MKGGRHFIEVVYRIGGAFKKSHRKNVIEAEVLDTIDKTVVGGTGCPVLGRMHWKGSLAYRRLCGATPQGTVGFAG